MSEWLLMTTPISPAIRRFTAAPKERMSSGPIPSNSSSTIRIFLRFHLAFTTSTIRFSSSERSFILPDTPISTPSSPKNFFTCSSSLRFFHISWNHPLSTSPTYSATVQSSMT